MFKVEMEHKTMYIQIYTTLIHFFMKYNNSY